MRLSAILILVGAAALPASALAQAQTQTQTQGTPQASDAPVLRPAARAPVVRTKWSLKDPSKKKAAQEAAAAKLGPAVPAPQRQRLPKAKATAKAGAPRKKAGVNATPVISNVARSLRKNN